MRLMCLFLVGIAAVACKGDPPAKPAERGRPVATPDPVKPALPAQPGEAPPEPAADPSTSESDPLFDAEPRDADWAPTAERQIHAVAPQLTNVLCKRAQCRVTLTAASEAELVGATEKLQGDNSLRGIDGVQHILLTRPEERGGKQVITIYVKFDR
jgi:hypothetical protein